MNISFLYQLFAYSALASYAVPIFIGLKLLSRIPKHSKVILLSCIISFCFFSSSFILFYFGIKNLFVSYISTFIGVSIKLLFFYLILNDLKEKIVVTSLMLIVILIDIYEGFVITQFKESNNITAIFEYIWVILIATYCFRNLTNSKVSSLREQPQFWFLFGMLTYAIMSFAFDTTSNQMMKYSYNLFAAFAFLVYISVIIMNILYAIGLTKSIKKTL